MWFDRRILIVIALVIAGLFYAIFEYRTSTVVAGFRAVRSGEFGIARDIFTRYADQGNPPGQYGLGLLHQKGWGTTPDARVAAQWYRRAAEQNFGPAQLALAALVETGIGGVGKDTVEAHVWYRLAVDNRVDRAVGGRDRTRQIMSAAEQARAEARIAKLQATFPQGEFSASKSLGVFP